MCNLIFCIGIIVVIWAIPSAFFIVGQQTCSIVERFGRFHKIALPGLNFCIPFIDSVKSSLSLRIHQLKVEVETKTQDNVFVNVVIAVQYCVLESKIYQAFYTLHDPENQIKAFVFDLVRAQVPLLKLDDVFAKKDNIANAVREELEIPMSEFGYKIIKALVTDIDPDRNVKSAMNEINTAQRLRLAATERAEADKILKVKQAEAEAEASILHGRGIAGQRRAIIEGLSQSVEEFVKQVPDTPAKNVMEMVLLIQYIDSLKEIGGRSNSNVVFVPHSPGSVGSLTDQIREILFAAEGCNKQFNQKSETR